MQPPTLTPTTDLIHGWGERCGERSGAVVTKCHRVEPPFAACTNYCPYGIDAERQREISEFAERKRIAIMCANESSWRESIKRELEAELEKRVREALLTPPPPPPPPGGATATPAPAARRGPPPAPTDLTPKERRHLAAEHWNLLRTRRRMREIVSRAGRDDGGGDGVGGSAEFHFNDRLARSNQDAYPGVFGLRRVAAHERVDALNSRVLVDFERLTANERRAYYRAFTTAGYQEALRSGCQADGTPVSGPLPGDYTDRFGIEHARHGPFWPSDYGPVCPTPRHRRPAGADKTALFSPKTGGAGGQTVDTQLTPFTTRWRGVQTVYDASRSNKDFDPPPIAAGHAPTILFESRFESGNLQQARRVGEFEYELVLRTDLYTRRHTQWFYFRLQGALPGITYKFRILNLLKRDSLYNHGLRPLLYSDKSAETRNISWVRVGHHINYTRNITNLQCPLLQRDLAYYLLEWQMEFPSADDTCYLAHCYPYTYTDLKDDLDLLLSQPQRSRVMRREVLCETRVGNSCFVITVTDFKDGEEMLAARKGIVVTGRVHPGESNSSWMMHGLLTFITGDSPTAKALRSRFIFKIVPMLNPDGVIVGNYRCSLAARDMNRNYRHPRRENFPTIWHTKALMEEFGKEHEIMVYCDLHGHSRKHNVFMYGCNRGDGGGGSAAEAVLRERLFPWLMAQKAPDKFSFRGCKFQIKRCKEATGRVVIFRQLRVLNSFTMEATFCGTTICSGENRHFNTYDFQQMGQVFSEAVFDYLQIEENQTMQETVFTQLGNCMMQQLLMKQGLLPPGLPDITTETGRQQMSEFLSAGTTLTLSQLSRELVDMINVAVRKQQQIARALPAADLDLTLTAKTMRTAGADDVMRVVTGDTRRDGALPSAVASLECVQLLEELNVGDAVDESDSSDTDSESDAEMTSAEARPKKKKRKKQKKHRGRSDAARDGTTGRHKENRHSGSTLPAIRCREGAGSPKRKRDTNDAKRSAADSPRGHKHEKNPTKTSSPYVSKYEGRSNGGIPCFSQERSQERSLKRMDELRKRLEEDVKKQEVYSEKSLTHADLQFRHPLLFHQVNPLPVQIGYINGNVPSYDVPPAHRNMKVSDDSSDSDFAEFARHTAPPGECHLPLLDTLQRHRLTACGVTASQPAMSQRHLVSVQWPRKSSLPTGRCERVFPLDAYSAAVTRHVTSTLVAAALSGVGGVNGGVNGGVSASADAMSALKRKLSGNRPTRKPTAAEMSDTSVAPPTSLVAPMSTPMLMSREYTQLLLNSLRTHRSLACGFNMDTPLLQDPMLLGAPNLTADGSTLLP